MRMGIFAALFYPFFVGALWPSRGPESLPVFLLSQFGKSLWIAWFVVAASLTLKLPDPLILLIVLVVVALVVRIRLYDPKVAVDRSITGKLSIALVIAVVFLCGELVLSGLHRPIFQTNDALESWNRWAIELARKEYHPYNAAYPILWPALWSLIYRAQNTTAIWIIAKGTLLILPILLALSVMLLVETRRLLAVALLVGFYFIFFLVNYRGNMFLGDMDIPVSVLIVVGGVVIYAGVRAVGEDKNEQAVQLALTAALFAGIAGMTKQPGVVMLIPVFGFVGFLTFTNRMQPREGAVVVALAVAPILVFLVIFLTAGQNPIGTLAQLQHYTGSSTAPVAIDLLRAMLPFPAMVVMLTLAVMNLFSYRRIEGAMGTLFMSMGVLGALAFASCCSYDERNGWWVICLFAISALFGLSAFEPVIRLAQKQVSSVSSTALLACGLTVALVAAVTLPGETVERIVRTQADWQWKLLPDGAVKMLESRLPLLGQTGKLVTEDNAVRWLPGYLDKVVICGPSQCVRSAIARHPNSLIVVRPSIQALVYNDLPELLRPEFLQGLIGDHAMYGPFTSEHLRR